MDVRDVGVALWRQRPLVALVLVITGAAVALGLFFAPKSYSATATISAVEAPGASENDDPDLLRGSVAELAGSRAVVSRVQGRIPVDRDEDELRSAVDGEWQRGTIFVEVTAADADPDVAAAIANAVAEVLVDSEVTEQVAEPSIEQGLVLTISERAVPPDTFTSPDVRLAVGLGALLALGLATAAAVVRDRRIHTVDDAAGAEEAATAPLLAHLAQPEDVTAMPALRPGTVEAEVFR
ncbi:MAG TPA: Wzz/FepE/Etk N-terminal domain-containing protein, partial [Nocardioides sp.]|nr:Wzz/FepE/Etk N-terminal domain-containing protein [Nocardioides sp.]